MKLPAFRVIIDHAQPRLAFNRICSVVQGLHEPESVSVKPTVGWGPEGSLDSEDQSNCWVDPVTGTLMLRPAPMTRKWDTTGTGIYARLAKSDFAFNDSSKWRENNASGNVSKFIELKASNAASIDRTAVTTATYSANQGFYVSLHNFSWGSSEFMNMRCGWNSSASEAAGVAVRLYANGYVQVLKDGELVGDGSIFDNRQESLNTANSFVRLFLIPYRKKELLITSNYGKGFTVVFDDIDEDEEDPGITGATNFWLEFPSGAVSFECAPIKYESTGWIASIPSRKSSAPGIGEVPVLTALSGGPGSVALSLVEVDDPTTAFTPDGTTAEWRIRADLTAASNKSPEVYAAIAEFLTLYNYTDDSQEQDITDHVVRLGFNIPESPDGFECNLTVKNLAELDPEGLLLLDTLGGRPYKIVFGEGDAAVTVVEGKLSSPRIRLSTTDASTFAEFTGGDMWQMLEDYTFTEETPLDTLYLHEAVEFVLESAGIPEDWADIETSAVQLSGPVGSGSRGDFQCKVEIGDTAAEWIKRLHEDYAATWYYGWTPTSDGPRFWFKSPESMEETPVLELYEEMSDSEAALPAEDQQHAWKYVARVVDTHNLDPEANRITVTGLDLRKRRPIIVNYNDDQSQDPTVAADARPDNWIGGLRPYGFQSPRLTSRSLCEDASELLAKRLTVRRYFRETENEMLIDPDTTLPLWCGQTITMDGEVWRMIAGRVEVIREPDDSLEDHEHETHWRESSYVFEKVVEGTAKGLGGDAPGFTLSEIRAFGWGLMGVRVQRSGSMENERKRPAVSATSL